MQFECRKRLHLGIGRHTLLCSIATELAAHKVLRVERRNRFEDFHFFIAYGFTVSADGRFHCQIGQHLEQMVLHDVAYGAHLLVEGAASLNAKILRHGYLHTLDMRAVPERFEQFIGKPEKQHAMNRLFAKVMVDSVNRFFVEGLKKNLVESTCRGEIATEWLFDDDTGVARAVGLSEV